MTDFEVTEVGAVDAAYERGRIAGLREAAKIVQREGKTARMYPDEAIAETYCEDAATSILALIPDTPEPEVMHDDAPRAIIGEIGNQIHNLGCEVQGNERLSEALADLASRTWRAAQMVSAEPSTYAPEPTGWQDIESAPRSHNILVCQGCNSIIATARWCNRYNYWSTGPSPMDCIAEVSHWQPLPAPPAQGATP